MACMHVCMYVCRCQSHLGRKGGVQYITLSDDCHDKVAVMHEMMIAIGREHEHQRYDRDSYVTVNWRNIVGEVKTVRMHCRVLCFIYHYSLKQ